MNEITLDHEGYWTDREGKEYRLVPVQPVLCQTDAALAKANRYGKKGKNAQAAAWDYMQGYMELVKFAPAPFGEINEKVSSARYFIDRI